MTTTQPKRQPIPFGKYLLLDRINIGGMAEVWRGKMFGAGGFERLVAIKRILPNIAEDDEFISMFIDEAKISVQLNHANVAQIYELGQISNSYFIAMEYIPGRDMRAIFDRARKKGEPAPVPLVAFVVSKMCEGLDYAHRKKDNMGRDLNIVHRDISPQNILISFEGEVKVIDFGIAKAAGKATKTQAGILKGKFGYMSPEQIRGLPLDRRSDIFAIGVCLYEMLTGERLFVGDSDFSVLEKVRKAEVAPPSTYNRRIPEALEKIVLKALARDVDERYQHANELGDDLQRFLLTSESIFSRKDLMQYMKSTFAEDVEREKLRLQEYADIKPPEGMLAAIEMGFSGASSAPAPTSPPVPVQAPVEAPPPPGVAGRRATTLTGLPRLTAATPPPPAVAQEEEESGATQVVMSGNYGLSAEPSTQPGVLGPGRTVTPVEVPRTATLEQQRTPSQRMPPVAAPPRAPVVPPGAESTTVGRQGRNTMDGLPRIVRPDAQGEPPMLTPARPSASHAAMTTPARPPVPAPPHPEPLVHEEEDSEFEEERSAAPPARAPRSAPSRQKLQPPAASNNNSRMALVAALLALVVVVVGVVGVFLSMRPEPTGFILVKLASDVRSPVQVNVSGTVLEVKSWPLLHQVKAGPGVVLVSADGYKAYTQQVVIEPGTTPTSLEVKLEREEKAARVVSVVIVTQPPDAELQVGDKVVRPKGDSSTYIGELPAGEAVVVAASAPGFKSARQTINPPAGDKPMNVQLKLEADGYEVEVLSVPSGATILAGGKDLGTTPARLRLPLSVKQMSLKLRCHDDVDVDVAPAGGGTPTTVKGRLKKQRGCR